MPVDQLAKISRYVGADGSHPPLSKLGGSRWDRMKARARRAAQELAGELLNLYAERKRRRGHAFPEFSDELRELEAAFPYRETPDQRDAIDAVLEDMETERPMDRLRKCADRSSRSSPSPPRKTIWRTPARPAAAATDSAASRSRSSKSFAPSEWTR